MRALFAGVFCFRLVMADTVEGAKGADGDETEGGLFFDLVANGTTLVQSFFFFFLSP